MQKIKFLVKLFEKSLQEFESRALKVFLRLQACFWRGSERPVDVRLEPTRAKRRPGETFHKWKKFPQKVPHEFFGLI